MIKYQEWCEHIGEELYGDYLQQLPPQDEPEEAGLWLEEAYIDYISDMMDRAYDDYMDSTREED
jgi:hypothetical protein